MEYHRLEVAKWQEEMWKNEKIIELYLEIQATGRVDIFLALYEVAAEFRNREKLKMLCKSLHSIIVPGRPQNMIELAETILGKRDRRVRSGMIYWAFDLHNLKLMVSLLFYVQNCLEKIKTWDIYMIRRIQRAKHLQKVIEVELWQDIY